MKCLKIYIKIQKYPISPSYSRNFKIQTFKFPWKNLPKCLHLKSLKFNTKGLEVFHAYHVVSIPTTPWLSTRQHTRIRNTSVSSHLLNWKYKKIVILSYSEQGQKPLWNVWSPNQKELGKCGRNHSAGCAYCFV